MKHKLTSKAKSHIIKEKRLDYVPDPRGLGYQLYRSMLLNGNVVAQIDAETQRSETYGDLLRRCIRTAANLLIRGITKDDIICQCSENHLNSCIPVICAFFLGIKEVTIDPSLTYVETTNLLLQIRPRIIFVSPAALKQIEKAIYQVGVACAIVVFGSSNIYESFDSYLMPVEKEKKFKPLAISDIHETAVVLYNRERKGSLRGVCLSHYSLMYQMVNTALCWNLGYRLSLTNYEKFIGESGFTVVMGFGSYYWITPLLVLLTSIVTSSVRIVSSKFDTSKVWGFIDEYKVSFMCCTTSQAIQLYKNEKPAKASGKSLRILLTTETSFSKPVLTELRKLLPWCFITNAYFEEEIGGPLCMFSFTKPGDIRDQYERPSSCGKILPGFSCKIVDPISENILGANQVGELRYKANFPINGYFKESRVDLLDKKGWNKSNDVAYYDERYCIHVLGFYNDVFRYKCWDIVPSVIENVLKMCPAVEEAVVLGIPSGDENIGKEPLGVVSLVKGMEDKVTSKEIEKFVAPKLTKAQKLVLGVKIMKQIPLTFRGKPNRREVEKLFG